MLHIQQLALMRENKWLCRDLSFHAKAGELWCILGPNGVGKTTLLHTLAGLAPPHQGEIFLNNQALSYYSHRLRAKHIGLLLQEPESPTLTTVYEALRSACYPNNNFDPLRLADLMVQLSLTTLAKRPIDTLSGGEKQRLQIALLLAQDPDILLMDEPINHLDLHFQLRCLKHLKHLAKTHQKLIITTVHDINFAQQYADYVCLLFPSGETLAGETLKIFSAKNLSNLYNIPLSEIRKGSQIWWIYEPF